MTTETMVGRRVRAPYHKIEGVVLRWEPLGAALCDVLVRDDAGRECWIGSGDARPADDRGPLPTRAAAIRAAAERAERDLTQIRADLVTEIRTGAAWPGAEHGKAILGRAVDGALAEVRRGR